MQFSSRVSRDSKARGSRERMSRSTLAEQLSEITSPSAIEFDPEDSYSTYAQEKSTPSSLLPGRADYLALTYVPSSFPIA